jgi:branched-subunit amino acid transport protein AzlD
MSQRIIPAIVNKRPAMVLSMLSIQCFRPVSILSHSITELALLPKKYILTQNMTM